MHIIPVHSQGPPFAYRYICVICKKAGETYDGYWNAYDKALRAGRKHCIEKHGGRVWPGRETTVAELQSLRLARKSTARSKVSAGRKKKPASPTATPTVPSARTYKRKKLESREPSTSTMTRTYRRKSMK